MVQAYDHRAASVVVNPENLNRPAQPREATSEEHANPDWLPDPQFWVRADSFNWPWQLEWVFGFKDITAATNRRTMIASLFPKAAFGNKVPVFLPVEAAATDSVDYKNCAVLLGGNFNSMAFDFIARQKVHGQTLNLYIVEQLPVIASSDYDRPFDATTARDLVRDHVLRLTYTAYDMAPFARDLGYHGPPFIWNEEERRHLQRPPRRAVLPPLRLDPGRSRLRVGHLPDSPPGRRGRVRQVSHPRFDPGLHERSGRRGYGDASGDVGLQWTLLHENRNAPFPSSAIPSHIRLNCAHEPYRELCPPPCCLISHLHQICSDLHIFLTMIRTWNMLISVVLYNV